MEDKPLDAFLESDSEENGDTDTEGATEVKPATSTARWGHDGQVCEQCGTAANRLWNDDGEFVCSPCKDW